jgi:hypothetical protein
LRKRLKINDFSLVKRDVQHVVRREIEAIWNYIDVVDTERKREKQHRSFFARKLTSIDDHYCDKLNLIGKYTDNINKNTG